MKKKKRQKLIDWLVFIVMICGFVLYLYWILSGHSFITVMV